MKPFDRLSSLVRVKLHVVVETWGNVKILRTEDVLIRCTDFYAMFDKNKAFLVNEMSVGTHAFNLTDTDSLG